MGAPFDTSDSGQMEMSDEVLQKQSCVQKQFVCRPAVLITTDNFILENISEQ